MFRQHKVAYVTFTDRGCREINEDAVDVFEKDGKTCFVLCDGLGGHGMGDIASSLTVNVFKDIFENTEKIQDVLPRAFMAAQDILLSQQMERHAGNKMKTTACGVVVDQKKAYIGHVGDSRVYVFNKDQVKKRTLDHSIPQMLVLSGDLKESEIRHHPDRNIVLRVIGVEWEKPMYELEKTMPLYQCQAFLLCTDGFWELIDETEMCRTLKESDTPSIWMDKMVEIVRKNGEGTNMDNFSAIAVWAD